MPLPIKIIDHVILACLYVDEEYNSFLETFYVQGTTVLTFVPVLSSPVDKGVNPEILNFTMAVKIDTLLVNYRFLLKAYKIDFFDSKTVSEIPDHIPYAKDIVIYSFFYATIYKFLDNYGLIYIFGRIKDKNDQSEYVMGVLTTNFCGTSQTGDLCMEKCARNTDTHQAGDSNNSLHLCYLKMYTNIYWEPAKKIVNGVNGDERQLNCPSDKPNLEQNNVCVSKCRDITPYVSTQDNKCVEHCAETELSLDNYTCLTDPLFQAGNTTVDTSANSCKEPRQFFYQVINEGYYCSRVCPTSQPYFTRPSFFCQATCSQFYTPEMECVSDCASTGKYKVHQGKRCLPQCEEPHIFDHNGECVSVCPSTASRISEGKCLQDCPSTAPYLTPENKCVSKCSDHGMFLEDDYCVLQCSYKKFKFLEGVCLAECPNEAEFFSYEKGCVSECPPHEAFHYRERKVCQSKCETKRFNLDTFECIDYCYGAQSIKVKDYGCASKCPSLLPYIDKSECVANCPSEAPLRQDKIYCVSSCPKLVNGEECIDSCKPEEEYSSVSKKCIRCSDLNKIFMNGACHSNCSDVDGFLTTEGKCVLCKETERHYGSTCVEECPSLTTEVLVGTKKVCSFCQDKSYFIFRDDCIPECAYNPVTDRKGNNICILCEDGFYFHNGICIKECGPRQIYDYVRRTCLDLPPDSNPCSVNPCMNKGKCVLSEASSFTYSILPFKCECEDSFGYLCQYTDRGKALNAIIEAVKAINGAREFYLYEKVIFYELKELQTLVSVPGSDISLILGAFLSRRQVKEPNNFI